MEQCELRAVSSGALSCMIFPPVAAFPVSSSVFGSLFASKDAGNLLLHVVLFMDRAARATQLYLMYKYLFSMLGCVSTCICGLLIAGDIVVKISGPAPAATVNTAAIIYCCLNDLLALFVALAARMLLWTFMRFSRDRE